MEHLNGKKIISVVLLIFLLSGLLGAGYFSDHLHQKVVLEAGETLQAERIWTGYGQAELTGAEDAVDTAEPGVYQTQLTLWGNITCPVQVTVQDTVAPMVTAQNVTSRLGNSCGITAFIASSQDATELCFSYVTEPDFQKTGTQQVEIAATDKGQNVTLVTAELFIPSVRDTVEVELGGTVPDAAAFLLTDDSTAEYVTDVSGIDTMKLGSNAVKVHVDGMDYDASLVVVDTIAPTAVVEPAKGWTKKELAPETFVSEVFDKSAVTVTYQTVPDWEKEGEQTIVICLTDEGSNVSEYPTVLTLEADTVAPSINASDITVKVGRNISYKKSISMTDNCDLPDDLKLEIDSAEVNLKQVGDYKVYCTATDTAGNESVKEITVHVVPEEVISYDIESINRMADEVLAKIIREDMTLEQKARAIYDWVHSNVSYINNSEKGNWLRGAYEGFKLHKGDCYVFYSTSRALLTRAGIPNLEIRKEKTPQTSQSNHYWNLVDIGSGWYHFDTTPRKDKTIFFLWTDAQMKEYSDSHRGSHNFTRELYPAIN